ncbi:MAG TPA: alkane 1-monooxygenase, partial [Alcanivorax sp.]|nr:alkane 1-monooxygenase [Alcanivorax sp.]
MLEKINPDTLLRLKKWGYLACWMLFLPMVPFSALVGREQGTQNLWAWMILAVFF